MRGEYNAFVSHKNLVFILFHEELEENQVLRMNCAQNSSQKENSITTFAGRSEITTTAYPASLETTMYIHESTVSRTATRRKMSSRRSRTNKPSSLPRIRITVTSRKNPVEGTYWHLTQ